MVIGESCAAGSYCSVQSGPEASNDIGISLTNNDLVFGDDLFLCPVEPVQDFAFVVQTGLGSVFVFGLLTVGHHSTTETHDNSVGVSYGEHDAVPEEINWAASLTGST